MTTINFYSETCQTFITVEVELDYTVTKDGFSHDVYPFYESFTVVEHDPPEIIKIILEDNFHLFNFEKVEAEILHYLNHQANDLNQQLAA